MRKPAAKQWCQHWNSGLFNCIAHTLASRAVVKWKTGPYITTQIKLDPKVIRWGGKVMEGLREIPITASFAPPRKLLSLGGDLCMASQPGRTGLLRPMLQSQAEREGAVGRVVWKPIQAQCRAQAAVCF